jgi:polysaccharide pyruvyl transferase CsaB
VRYLLAGYYGMRNVGDDVLLYATLAETARHDRNASFTVISDLPELTPPGLRVRIAPGGRRLENVRQMLRHDVWLFGGGGLLQDGSPRAADYLERLGRSAHVIKLMRRRIALVGIGVGPLTTERGRVAAATLLGHADLVTVRDDESRALIAEVAPGVTVHVTGDPAFLLRAHAATVWHAPRPGKVLGVSLLPYARSLGGDAESDDRAAVGLARALAETLRRHPDWRVTLFEFFAHREYGDAHVLRTVERELADPARVTYRPYTGDFLAVFAEMRACQAFVGMRFHSCLLAHLAGVPCLMLAYHPKSESLATRLGLHPDAVAPLPVLHDARALGSRLDALLTDGAKFRPAVALEALTAAAARNFTLLSACLTGGRARARQRQGRRG